MTVDLARAKTAVAVDLAPGHPGRELLLSLPDRLPEREFDLLFPSLIRVLRIKDGGTNAGSI